mgnify:FL=1
MRSNRTVLFTWLVLGALFAAACGKNLSQILFAPSVEKRAGDSINGGLTAPTAMVPASATQFSFAVFGDVQVRTENKTLLTRFKQDIVPNAIEFVVVLGDLSEDGKTSQQELSKANLAGLGIPYYATIGNHDLFQESSSGEQALVFEANRG